MLVTGTFLDSNGNPRSGERIKFTPLSNPQADQTGVLTAIDIVTTAGVPNGFISIDLEQGFYEVAVGRLPRDRFKIQVPDSSGTADIVDLMISSLSPLNLGFRIKNGFLQLKNVDTDLWHTIRVSGEEGFEQFDILPGEA